MAADGAEARCWGRLVSSDGLQQVVGAAIVQEENSLTKTPQWGSAEHVSCGSALGNVVGQTAAHVMHQEIAVGVGCHVLKGLGFTSRRSDHGCGVAQNAADSGIGSVGAERAAGHVEH